MPKAEYVTWGGQRFEGSGVKPDVEVPLVPLPSSDIDNQADVALRILHNHWYVRPASNSPQTWIRGAVGSA